MARTEGQWKKGISFISPSEDVPILLRNTYLNFGGSTIGESGYGIRDNAGAIEVKSDGGSWAAVATGGGETNTASNLGAGEGVYASKIGVALKFKSLVAGTGISLASDGNEITLTATSGSGDVVGPASAVDDNIATYDLTTGKLIQDGGKTIAEVLDTDNHTDGTTNKVYTATEKTKLAGVEALADVTDTANVTSAGALMDSEVTNLAQVKAFDSSDYATASQGALADSAVQPGDLATVATTGAYSDLSGTPDLSVYDSFDQYADLASFPATGDADVVYVAQDTGYLYRWTGSAYAQMSAELALGETSSTAYRGDRGKTAYDHTSVTTGNPHNVTKSDVGLGNVDNTSDANKPISTATQTALNLKTTVSSGSGAPATTPTKEGDIYTDTTADLTYIATGTTSSADWKVQVAATGGTPSKGALLVGDGVDSFDELAVGANGFKPVAASGESLGIKWVEDVEVKGITVENPTSSEDIGLFFTDVAITVTQMNAVLRGSSTPSVTWTVRHNSDRSATGAEVVTSGTTTTSTSTGSEVTSFNDATIPAGSWVWLETTAQSGTVNELTLSIEFKRD